MSSIEDFFTQWIEDKAFRTKVRAKPSLAMEYADIPVSPFCEIKLVEDTPQLMHIVLPPKRNKDLEDASLEHLSAGLGTQSSHRLTVMSHSMLYGGMSHYGAAGMLHFGIRPSSASY